MERLDLALPENFRYGKELGLIIASQISIAIGNGVLHFKSGSYEELLNIASIMKAIHEDGCILSWHKTYGDQSMGLHGFGDTRFRQVNHFIPIAEEVYKQIKPLLS